MSHPTLRRALPALLTTLALALTACGTGDPTTDPTSHHDMGDMGDMGDTGGMDMGDMTGAMDAGTGLSAEVDGYRFQPSTTTLPAGTPTALDFTITDGGSPLTAYQLDQTVRLHFYAVRSDLTGFQHVHPTLATDGTWTAPLAALAPGTWRLYTAFIPDAGPRRGDDVVLSTTITVPGSAATAPLPAPSRSATVGGDTVTISGTPYAGRMGMLRVTFTRDGRPVRDLEPYLDTYAHLTAIHAGDLAFAHLHPVDAVRGDHGGPTLTFHSAFGQPGRWRVFLQFRTGGRLHTAPITLAVR